jgi:5'-nucleotidase
MSKQIIYVDMDDTICKFTEMYSIISALCPETEYPQSLDNFFLKLQPIDGAIEYVNKLRADDRFEVYILTAPSYMNPKCYTEKRLWIEIYFDLEFCKNLIICNNKGLCKGDFLIDDHVSGRGQEDFEGTVIPFGHTGYKGWPQVYKFITNS